MRFLGQCNLSYAVTEALILLCEVIEEVWTNVVYKSKDKAITFNLKGNQYSINGDVLRSYLHLPSNTHAKSPTETEIRLILNEINYVAPDANLGKIVKKNLRKELSYFLDSLIKVFSWKDKNFLCYHIRDTINCLWHSLQSFM